MLAESRLMRSGYSVLRRVRCEYQDGILRLHGCLPNHSLTQVALSLVAEIDGVRGVVNEIEVLHSANGEAAERYAWIEA